MKYDFSGIEKKWQAVWEKEQIYFAQDNSKKEKKYILIEFPYPSGEGLHMGHLRPYVAGDVYSRFLRMRGYEVMYPIGWDAFGLPAENFAIKKGIHPRVTTAENIENAKRQIKSWGIGFDWLREVNTTDPDYYKWTQWIFLKLFEKGLAYEATGKINWCPRDKTGLANEEVVDGKCERCGAEVEQKELRQWYLKITAYAEKLLEGLKTLNWPEKIKIQQENWIGRSEGAEIDFEINKKYKFVLLHGLDGSPKSNFFPWLKKELEMRGHQVEIPELPNAKNPNIEKQVQYVLKTIKFNTDTVLLGHSLGATVALKVMESVTTPIHKLILAAGTSMPDKEDKKYTYATEFDWKFNFEKIKRNTNTILILRDSSDDVVPWEEAGKLQRFLGGVVVDFTAEDIHISGKKEPAILENAIDCIKVFTTRPDTLFGATYMVVAPEYGLIEKLKDKIINFVEVKKYITSAKKKTDEERTNEKTGVELKGIKAINPANKTEIPIFVADYVLSGYGTGAIMAVPAHDERDFEFAKKFNLEIKKVILPILIKNPIGSAQGIPSEVAIQSECWIGNGQLINSDKFDGMDSEKAKQGITEFVGGKNKVQYRLRDWVFSRQRYWGEPIPLVHCSGCGIVAIPEEDLPVLLPEVKKYEPTGTGESPLAAITEWVNTKCPKCGGPAKRETNTMPQWGGSSWYYLRYVDPKNTKAIADPKLLKHWLPVDVYFGGMEHTTLHLLYSRFWHRFLYDEKIVPTPEPYTMRIPHGIILGADGEKMSKSRDNVANPDKLAENFGADALRMHELFLGPHDASVTWNDQGILGISRFLERVWKKFEGKKNEEEDNVVIRWMHRTTKKIEEDIKEYKFNTAISSLMICLNETGCFSWDKNMREMFLKILAPFAPHLAEELWNQLGNKDSIHKSEWPEVNEKYLIEGTFELVVQINGKHRGTISVPTDINEKKAVEAVMKNEKIAAHFSGKTPKRVIFVPNRLINFVL